MRFSPVEPAATALLCYADGAEAWSISDRSRVLLAGGYALLDSGLPDFDRTLQNTLSEAVSQAELRILREGELRRSMRSMGLIGDSAAMRKVYRQATRIAPLTDLPVLLTGETGVGKELLARAIYQLDLKRSRGPFVALNCAAVSPELAEAELFGYRKGAFTGAVRDRQGLFRAAEGGILFLDEIGELPAALQGKLLRALQERRVLPIGEEQETCVDIRVMAATNRDLAGMIEQNLFRQDLYQRLRALSIEVPPLAARREDIPELVAFFVEKYCALAPAGPARTSAEFVEALSTVALPGNVRELENIVRQTLIHKDDSAPLSLADLPREIIERLARGTLSTGVPRGWPGAPADSATDLINSPFALRGVHDKPFSAAPIPNWNVAGDMDRATLAALPPNNSATLSGALDECERELLRSVLQANKGNRTAAARVLGVTPRSIYNKIRKHGLGK